MKKSIKNYFMGLLFKVYEPLVLRFEKGRAVYMWRRGIRLADAMYQEIGAPRVYLFFDTKHRVWAPMTYQPNRLHKPSLRMFRRMGKARGVAKIQNVEDMKEYSFYYTASKWGAVGCDIDNRTRQEKLEKWITYYLYYLSPLMRKCQEYRRAASSSRR